jgi:hypothetical protein
MSAIELQTNANENNVLDDWMQCIGLNSLHIYFIVMYAPSNGNAITSQTIPMTDHLVVILELQPHVRIGASFDSIWIID